MAPAAARYCVPAATRAAIQAALRSGLEPLKAEPPQNLADWAAAHFRLTADSSHQQGGWQAWPPQLAILHAFSNDDIEQVDVKKAKRVGYTKMLVAYIAYTVAHRRRKLGLWQPTDDDRDSFVQGEVDPMMEEVPAVRAARRASGSSKDTMKYKTFRGCVAHFLGGKAARAYRRITLDSAIMDEISAFDQVVEKSIDPIGGARGRLEGAPFPKFIVGSTPRLDGLCQITREAENADERMRYHIACPLCEVEHPLEWGGKESPHGFKWQPGRHETAHHICPHCRQPYTQAQYLAVWQTGVWVGELTGIRATNTGEWFTAEGQPTRPPRHVAFVDYWAAYSPQRTWADIADEAIKAVRAKKAGDSAPMIGFTNETLARAWRESYEASNAELIQQRARMEGLPLGIIPAGASILTQYIDVQKDRWEYGVIAHGRAGELWLVDYGALHGNTADLQQWEQKVEPRLGASYPHANGGRLAVSATGIDSGYNTHEVYLFARAHQNRNVHATKGDNAIGTAIKHRRVRVDISHSGRTIRSGVALWHIGVDTAKDLIHGRLQLSGQGPGRLHFPAAMPEEFYKQLTSNQRVKVRSKTSVEERWIKPSGAKDEALDIVVGNLFLAELLDLPKWTDRQWLRAENALAPDLFDPPATQEPPPPAQPLGANPTSQKDTPPPLRPAAAPAAPRHRPPPPAAGVGVSDEWMSRL